MSGSIVGFFLKNALIRAIMLEIHHEQFCENEAGREMINDEAINKVFVKYRTTAPSSGIVYQKTDEFAGKDKKSALNVAAQHNGTIVFQR